MRTSLTSFLGIIVSWAALMPAQTLDTGILGTVTDSSGAVVVGAAVTITQPATGYTRTVTSSAEGAYEVRYLVPGEYAVEVKANGFRSERRTGIVVQTSKIN